MRPFHLPWLPGRHARWYRRSSSAASICRIGPRRGQERHMIIRLGLGNGEPNWHNVEKRRPARFHTPFREVGTDVKGDLIVADAQRAPSEQGDIRPPISIGDVLLKHAFPATGELFQDDPHARRRSARHQIEHVRGKPTIDWRLAGTLHDLVEPQSRDMADLIQCRRSFGLPAVGNPSRELTHDGRAGVAPYADDEWHAEPLAIVAIKALEALQLCPAQAIEAEITLLLARGMRQGTRARHGAGEFRMTADEGCLLSLAGTI